MRITTIFIITLLVTQSLVAEPTTVESLERRIQVLEEKIIALAAQVSESKNKEERPIAPELPARAEIIVNVLEDGRLRVDGKEVDDDEFTTILKSVVAEFPNQPVIIRGGEVTKNQHIVHAADLCQKAGIWAISFGTTEKKAEQDASGNRR